MQHGNWFSGKAFATAGVGAISGALGALTGGAMASAGTRITGTLMSGTVGGAVSGATGGIGNYMVSTNSAKWNIGEALGAAGKGLAFGAASGLAGSALNVGMEKALSHVNLSPFASGATEVAASGIGTMGINAGIQYYSTGKVDWSQAVLSGGIAAASTAARVWQLGAIQSKGRLLNMLTNKQINKMNQLFAEELGEPNFDINKQSIGPIRIGTHSKAILPEGTAGITISNDRTFGIFMGGQEAGTFVHESYHYLTYGPEYAQEGYMGAYPFETAVMGAR